jgi:hypothetical protein
VSAGNIPVTAVSMLDERPSYRGGLKPVVYGANVVDSQDLAKRQH